MEDMTISQVFKLFFAFITQGDSGKIFIAVGVITLLLALFAMYKSISSPPSESRTLSNGLTILCFISGTTFLVIGSAIGFITAWRTQNSMRVVKEITTQEEALRRLEHNEHVSWLIRLVPRKASEENLGIDKLASIGKDDQKFTFVTDYDELRGKTASDAVRMLGLNIDDDDKVSAIIFPVASRRIYPVNARGLLQVIAEVETDSAITDKFMVNKALQKEDYDALNIGKRETPAAYAWANYKNYYRSYCQVAQNFRCSPRQQIAKSIGDVSDDWHPLGFSKLQPDGNMDPCRQTNDFCSISDWSKDTPRLLARFGARVFLTKNVAINTIKNRILIDFDDPKHQKIPYLYLENSENSSYVVQANPAE